MEADNEVEAARQEWNASQIGAQEEDVYFCGIGIGGGVKPFQRPSVMNLDGSVWMRVET